jgi:hypothetical protein
VIEGAIPDQATLCRRAARRRLLRGAELLAHLPKVYGEVMAEMPRDLYIPPDALEIILESFEGPLDLLLYLIRRPISTSSTFRWRR